MKKTIPEIVDMRLPLEGIFHNLMLVAIDKRYPGHARKIMHAIWGTGQMMFSKTIVVVDEDVDVRNGAEVLWKALTAIDPERDIHSSAARSTSSTSPPGCPATAARWASTPPASGRKRASTRRWPDEILMSADVKKKIDALWPALGIGPGAAGGAARCRIPGPV